MLFCRAQNWPSSFNNVRTEMYEYSIESSRSVDFRNHKISSLKMSSEAVHAKFSCRENFMFLL